MKQHISLFLFHKKSFEQDKNQSLIENYLREELPHVVQLMDARMEELKVTIILKDKHNIKDRCDYKNQYYSLKQSERNQI